MKTIIEDKIVELFGLFVDETQKEIESKYNNHFVEFCVGDRVWYNPISTYCDPIECTITEIDDRTHFGQFVDEIVYYKLEPILNNSILEKFEHFMPHKRNRFPTSYVEAGFDFFRTKQEVEDYQTILSLKKNLVKFVSILTPTHF